MRNRIPTGTVTFLFTDVEGSTKLLHELGPEAYAAALAEHRQAVREACSAEGGVEVDTQGDAFFFAFPTAPGAVAAAAIFSGILASGPIQVRAALHTGTPLLTDEGYVGADVHRAARIAAAGHGGQVLVSASTAPLVGVSLCDLGEHRLKDLSAPERIHQLGDDDFPPLKTLYRTNLPVPATPFLGRERELAEVVELLTGDSLRLLTLTGPGGTGKTRLALQAAAEASGSFPDGVFWVPLTPLRDPELVLPTLARTLTVTAEAGKPLEDTLVAHLSGKTMLLLLDNVEHLLPHAAERIAALRAANGSCVLVTSRERLRIGGEQTWPVPPLNDADATALFLVRARAVDPSFVQTQDVPELCTRLDELPLAIELAAARTAVFSAEQLLERLSQRLDLLKGDRDADPRQQTLRATIEWSHELLTDDDQRLFARLAVFVSGCTYEAAEEVAGADPDSLQSLLDKSLLRKRETDTAPRYWMLETIRELAAERLRELPEYESVCDRHVDYFFALAQRAEPELERADQAAWLDRIEAELDNFRAALDRAQETGRGEEALRAAIHIQRLWDLRATAGEVLRRFEELLSIELPLALRADGLRNLGQAALLQGDNERAWAVAEERLAIYRALGDDLRSNRTLQNLALIAGDRGDLVQARALISPVVEWARGVSEYELTYPLDTLAFIELREGNYDEALALLEESLGISERLGDDMGIANCCDSVGTVHLYTGHLEAALPVLRRSLRLWRDLSDRGAVGYALTAIALVASMRGEARETALLLGKSDGVTVEVGRRSYSGQDSPYDRAAAAASEALGAEAFDAAYAEGRSMSFDHAMELARSTIA